MSNTLFKEKLHTIIHTSSLAKDQITLWDLFLRISNGQEDEAIFEAINEGANEENLELLTEHLRSKILNMKSENKKIWKNVLSTEKRFSELF